MLAAPHRALTAEEQAAIVLAVQTTFGRLSALHQRVGAITIEAGFAAVAPVALVSNLPDAIAESIGRQCASFVPTPHRGAAGGVGEMQRDGVAWRVVLTREKGLTLPHGAPTDGSPLLVVAYRAPASVAKVWVLWKSDAHLFSSTRTRASVRTLVDAAAAPYIQVLQANDALSTRSHGPSKRPTVKAGLRTGRRLVRSHS